MNIARTRIHSHPRRSLLWLALVAAIGVGFACNSVAAQSDDDEEADNARKLAELTQVRSEVEVGMCYVNDDSFRFGRYNGLDGQGLSLMLDFDYEHRAPYDAPASTWWSLRGSNVGLENRQLSLQFGMPGSYRAHVDYDQIPSRRHDETRTIYDGAGGNTLTLPSGWVAAQNTAGLTKLLPSLQGFDIETERRRTAAGIDARFGPQWSFSSQVRHEVKDGIKSLGAVFGNSGGNPRSTLLPEPVDYSTDEFELAARYFTKRWQFQAAYYGSNFNDHNSYVSFQNPYTTIAGWAATSGYPTGIGQMSTPPDNRFQQVTLDGGYNFSEHTRLSASFARGRMTQDATFLPYTANPALQSQVTIALPRDSLDGRIDTTVATIKLSSHPWTEFFWNAQVRYDDRDNQTPRDRYVYIGGDTQVQPTATNSDRIRFNEPYSYKDEQFKLEAGYKVFKHTELSASAEHRKTDRTYSEREQADENLFRVALRSELTDWLSGNMRWTHAKRDGSTYNGAEPLETAFAPEFAATLAGGFENIPALRKFNQADRTRDIASTFFTVTPIPSITLSAGVDYALDDYSRSEIGLTLARIRSYTLDAVYAPGTDWSLYGYYTHEKMDSNQAGRSINGATRVADSVDPRRNWFAFHRDALDTGGLGFKHSFPERHMEVSADYVNSRSDAAILFNAGSAIAFAPLPAAKTRLNSLVLTGSWQMRDDLAFKLRYWYEKYDSSDWQIDSLVPNTLANVITNGESSQDYKAHVVFASMTYRF